MSHETFRGAETPNNRNLVTECYLATELANFRVSQLDEDLAALLVAIYDDPDRGIATGLIPGPDVAALVKLGYLKISLSVLGPVGGRPNLKIWRLTDEGVELASSLKGINVRNAAT